MIHLTDIILWERLQRKPFGDFDGGSMQDVLALMYCNDHRRDDKTGELLRRIYTFDTYCKAVEHSPQELRRFADSVERDIRFCQQFADDRDDDGKEHDNTYVGDVVGSLIFAGIDPSWLERQGVEMLPILAKWHEHNEQQQLSDRKFWTLLSMSPHLDKKGNEKLRRALEFEWEREHDGQKRLTEEQEMAFGSILWGKKKTSTNEKE